MSEFIATITGRTDFPASTPGKRGYIAYTADQSRLTVCSDDNDAVGYEFVLRHDGKIVGKFKSKKQAVAEGERIIDEIAERVNTEAAEQAEADLEAEARLEAAAAEKITARVNDVLKRPALADLQVRAIGHDDKGRPALLALVPAVPGECHGMTVTPREWLALVAEPGNEVVDSADYYAALKAEAEAAANLLEQAEADVDEAPEQADEVDLETLHAVAVETQTKLEAVLSTKQAQVQLPGVVLVADGQVLATADEPEAEQPLAEQVEQLSGTLQLIARLDQLVPGDVVELRGVGREVVETVHSGARVTGAMLRDMMFGGEIFFPREALESAVQRDRFARIIEAADVTARYRREQWLGEGQAPGITVPTVDRLLDELQPVDMLEALVVVRKQLTADCDDVQATARYKLGQAAQSVSESHTDDLVRSARHNVAKGEAYHKVMHRLDELMIEVRAEMRAAQAEADA